MQKLAHLAQEMPVDVRFIEVMPIGFGRFEKGPTEDEVLQILQAEYPDLALPYYLPSLNCNDTLKKGIQIWHV